MGSCHEIPEQRYRLAGENNCSTDPLRMTDEWDNLELHQWQGGRVGGNGVFILRRERCREAAVEIVCLASSRLTYVHGLEAFLKKNIYTQSHQTHEESLPR